MHGLVVIEGMTLSGHPWIINEIIRFRKTVLKLRPNQWEGGLSLFVSG